MYLRDPKIRPDQAYAPATAARHLGVDPGTLDTWLASGELDLSVFTLPDGQKRVPGHALLAAVRGGISREMEQSR